MTLSDIIKEKLPYILTLFPISVLLFFILFFKIDLPYWDQWELVPLLEKLLTGKLTFGDIWANHNEHRILFPQVIMLSLAYFTDWNITYELILNFILGIGIFSLLIHQISLLSRENGFRISKWVYPLIALIVFSITQYKNWTWGWQIQILMSVLATVIGIILLSKSATRLLYFFSSLFFGIIASYSFANGLLYWPLGLCLLIILPFKQKYLKIAIWILTACIVTIYYFYNIEFSSKHTSLFGFLLHPINYSFYIFSYLGATLIRYNKYLSFLIGLTGVLYFLYSIWKNKSKFIGTFHPIVPIYALAFYSIATALLTGLGRVESLGGQSLSSRYITMSSFFWIAIIIHLIMDATDEETKEIEVTVQRKRHYSKISIFIIILLLIINSINSGRRAIKKYYELHYAQEKVLDHEDLLYLKEFYPSRKKVIRKFKLLKKYNLNVFSNK